MISRVAENLYWLQRYVERAENTARLLRVTHQFALDVPGTHPWTSVLIVQGAQPVFLEHHDAAAQDDGDLVSDWLTWSEDCPVSITRSLRAARENARTTRETVSREVWETLNEAWLWLTSDSARTLYEHDREGFFNRVRGIGHQVRGAAFGTMLRDEPLWFMELGNFLERAEQTARALDVRHHLVGDDAAAEVGQTLDTVAWILTLLTCSGYEGFFKRHRKVSPKAVTAFLLLNEDFPRSVAYALREAITLLDRISAASPHAQGRRAADRLRALQQSLVVGGVDGVIARGLHDELTRVVDDLVGSGGDLYAELFDPQIPVAGREATQ